VRFAREFLGFNGFLFCPLPDLSKGRARRAISNRGRCWSPIRGQGPEARQRAGKGCEPDFNRTILRSNGSPGVMPR